MIYQKYTKTTNFVPYTVININILLVNRFPHSVIGLFVLIGFCNDFYFSGFSKPLLSKLRLAPFMASWVNILLFSFI